MFLYVVCAWCERVIGIKEAKDAPLPISHSICCECKRKLEEETKTILPETSTIQP